VEAFVVVVRDAAGMTEVVCNWVAVATVAVVARRVVVAIVAAMADTGYIVWAVVVA